MKEHICNSESPCRPECLRKNSTPLPHKEEPSEQKKWLDRGMNEILDNQAKSSQMIYKPQESLSWREEFREYFDKTLKPKKPTIQNLDRELLVDFISKLEKGAHTKGVVEGELRGWFDALDWVGRILSYKSQDKVREMVACEIEDTKNELKSKGIPL